MRKATKKNKSEIPNQLPNIYGTIGIILIIAGVLIVNLLGKVD